MAQQLKYISENGKLYLDEIQPIIESLYSKLEEMGAKGNSYTGTSSGEFIFQGEYELPRQGAILFHFKELAERSSEKLSEEFNYNVLVNFLGFREDTKKYQEMKSSIEDILLTEAFDKIE